MPRLNSQVAIVTALAPPPPSPIITASYPSGQPRKPRGAPMATVSPDKQRSYNEQKELQALRRVFDAMDQNGDGLVDLKELTSVLARLDYRAKKSEARASLALSMDGGSPAS